MIVLTFGVRCGGQIKEFAPEAVTRVIEAERSVGLSEQECSFGTTG